MKKILILITIIILLIFGFNKYQDYKRFNGPATNYVKSDSIDTSYYNKSILLSYENAIAQLNAYVNTQWSTHGIDVINPKKENKHTQYAVSNYAQKLAQVKYYETFLEKSALLKEKGLSNNDIRLFEETGLTPEAYQQWQEKKQYQEIIKNSFTDKKIDIGDKSALVYEVQKMLTKNGFPVTIDGIFKTETSNGLKGFETKHNLLPDGKLDPISLAYLLKNN